MTRFTGRGAARTLAAKHVKFADRRRRGEFGLLVRVAPDVRAGGWSRPAPAVRCSRSSAGSPRPASRRRSTGRQQHDDAEVMGDDVVQFPGDPCPLQRPRPARPGAAWRRSAPRRGGPPAGVNRCASQPECQQLQERQYPRPPGRRLHPARRPAPASPGGRARPRPGRSGPARRPHGAAWRARPVVGGGQQHEGPRHCPAASCQRAGTAALWPPRSPEASGAERGGKTPAARQAAGAAAPAATKARRSPRCRSGGASPRAATAVSPAPAIPSPASTTMPGFPPAKRPTACMSPKVSPGQAMRIILEATSIGGCRLNRFDPAERRQQARHPGTVGDEYTGLEHGRRSMNVVEASGLGKRYGRTWALRECTLEIPAGRVTALGGAERGRQEHAAEPGGRPDPAISGRVSPCLAAAGPGRRPRLTGSRSWPRTRRCTRPCRSRTSST